MAQEPLAILVLSVPFKIAHTILKLYMAVVMLLPRTLSRLATDFLYKNPAGQYPSGISYILPATIQGAVSLAYITLNFISCSLPHLLYHFTPEILYQTESKESTFQKIALNLILGGLTVFVWRNEAKRTKRAGNWPSRPYKNVVESIADILSLFLAAVVLLLIFRAKNLIRYKNSTCKRKFFTVSLTLALLSILDTIVLVFILILHIIPIRLSLYKSMIEKENNEFFKKGIAVQQASLTIFDLISFLVFLDIWFIAYILGNMPGFKESFKKFNNIGILRKQIIFLLNAVCFNFFKVIVMVLNFPFLNSLSEPSKETQKFLMEREYKMGIGLLGDGIALGFSKWFFIAVWFLSPKRFGILCAAIEDYDSWVEILAKRKKQNNGYRSFNAQIWFQKINMKEFSSPKKRAMKTLLIDKTSVELQEFCIYLCFEAFFQAVSDFFYKILAFSAIFLNPLRGFETFIKIWRFKIEKVEDLDKMNKQISLNYPLIFFDIPITVLAIFSLFLSFVLNFKLERNLLEILFTKKNSPKSSGILIITKLQNEDQESDIDQKKNNKRRKYGIAYEIANVQITKEKYIFSNIFLLLKLNIRLIFSSIISLVTILLLITTFDVLKEFSNYKKIIALSPIKNLKVQEKLLSFVLQKNLNRFTKIIFYLKPNKKFVEKLLKEQTDTKITEIEDFGKEFEYKLSSKIFYKREVLLKRVLYVVRKERLLRQISKLFSVNLKIKNSNQVEEQPKNNYESCLQQLESREAEIAAKSSLISSMIIFFVFEKSKYLLLWRISTFNNITNPAFLEKLSNSKNKLFLLIKIWFKIFLELLKDLVFFPLYLVLVLNSTSRHSCRRRLEILNAELALSEVGLTNYLSITVPTYLKNRREIISSASKGSVDRLLRKLTLGLSYIFFYRRPLVLQLQSMNELHLIENINSKKTNLLIFKIYAFDIVYSIFGMNCLILAPPRFISFVFYVKNGELSRFLNPDIIPKHKKSFEKITSEINSRRNNLIHRIIVGFTCNIFITLILLVLTLFPIRFYKAVKELTKLKKILKQKSKKENISFVSKEFSRDLLDRFGELLMEIKKDLINFLTILIILTGVYHIKSTYQRIKIIFLYQVRKSSEYIWIKTLFTKKIRDDQSSENIFSKVGHYSRFRVAEFLTIKDRMELGLVNKSTRKIMIGNSMPWMDYYQKNINPELKKDFNHTLVSLECLEHYRKEVRQNNSTELDLELGIEFVLKDEAIQSVIDFPELILLPYKVLYRIKNFFSLKNESPIEFITRIKTERNPIFDGTVIANPYRYPANFQPHFSGFSHLTQPTDEGVKGFLILEVLSLKIFFFIISVYAIFRSLFRWIFTFEETRYYHIVGKSYLWLGIATIKLTGQIIYGMVFGYFYYRWVRVLTGFGFDFLHALLGPMGLHGIFILNFFTAVSFNPNISGGIAKPWMIFVVGSSILKKGYFDVAKPVAQIIGNILKFLFVSLVLNTLNGLKRGAEVVLKSLSGAGRFLIHDVYNRVLVDATKRLTGKGTLLEILHLVVTLFWILWPILILRKVEGLIKWFLILLMCSVKLVAAIRIVKKHAVKN